MVKDAIEASGNTHKKVFENEEIRVLAVEIQPGIKEALHMHPWCGIMIVTSPAMLRYYNGEGDVEFEGLKEGFEWFEPTKEHAVENTDSKAFKAYRVELKK